MSVHKIRLAGPWESSPVDTVVSHSGLPDAQAASIRHPCQLPFQSDKDRICSSVLLVRRFHCPTGITEKTTLFIALEVRHAVTQVRLNGSEISRASSNDVDGPVVESVVEPLQRFEILSPLKPFNELNVLLTPLDTANVATLVSVSLEIHE